jgi:nitroimidazol reductase NimA-like FMN-containing flavoprotein (pyridoxamine 5'-phosphate oxidase superfamily)
MLACTGFFHSPTSSLSEPQDIYLHGYVSSRIMRLPTSPALEENEDGEEGMPICIAATHVDGLILALTPNHHSMNYRSAVVHGYASLVIDEKEKLYAMELVTNNVIPNRWENTRIPPNKTEMTSTSILRVRVVDASAKVRNGGPGEDRGDERDEKVRGSVWTGVIPVWTKLGEPVPGKENRVTPVPNHVESLVKEWNEEAEKTARKAIEGTKSNAKVVD